MPPVAALAAPAAEPDGRPPGRGGVDGERAKPRVAQQRGERDLVGAGVAEVLVAILAHASEEPRERPDSRAERVGRVLRE